MSTKNLFFKVVHNSNDSDKGTSRSTKNTDLVVMYDDITNQAQ